MSTQNFAADLAQTRGKQADIGMWTVTALSTLVVLIRLFARIRLIKEIGWDDYLIVASQLFAWADMALSLMTVKYGAGEHLESLIASPAKMVKMYKFLVAAQMVYFATLWLCRVSGLAFYARLNPMPRFQLYIRLAFAFVTAVWVSQALIIGLQCIPLQALWDTSVKGRCITSTNVFLSTSIMTIICDSLILVLPVKIVWRLQISLGRKLTLLLIFCFGVFAIVTSILRMVAMIVALDHPSDITWYFSPVMAWSEAEISAMIIALSLPALRGLFGFFKRSRSQKSNSGGTGSIGLTSVPQSKNRIYDGPVNHDNTAGVDSQRTRSSSQEALWDVKDAQQIRIMDTVHVDVDDVQLGRQRSN